MSSTRNRDFTLEGAVYNGRVQLSPNVPEGVRRAISGRFEVEPVAAVSQSHPITERFQAHVQRGLDH